MKTCPVCGAGAFDDAEVCFGCLHKYEKGEAGRADGGASVGAPGASPSIGGAMGPGANPHAEAVPSPGFRTQGASPALRPAQSAAAQAPAPVAQAVQAPGAPSASRAQPEMRALPVRQEPCVAEPVSPAAAEVERMPQAASMFDGTGWVVRFEFPGFAPAPPAGRGMQVERAEPGALGRGCALLAENRPRAQGGPCGMVVRFEPEPAGALEDPLRSKPSRGSHARGLMAESRSVEDRERS